MWPHGLHHSRLPGVCSHSLTRRLELSFSKGRMWIQFLAQSLHSSKPHLAASKLHYLFTGSQEGSLWEVCWSLGRAWRRVSGSEVSSPSHTLMGSCGLQQVTSFLWSQWPYRGAVLRMLWYLMQCGSSINQLRLPFWESTFYGSLSFGRLSSTHWALPPYSRRVILISEFQSEHCLPGRIQNFIR